MTDNIMFIDVETIGLPVNKGYGKYYPPCDTQYYDTSRIIEIAYIVCSNDGQILKKYNELIIPNGFTIENSEFHGITTEEAKNKGKYINDVLTQLCLDLDNVDTIVAHNIQFDINNILSECHRINYEEIIHKISYKEKQCTMAIGKNLMMIPDNYKSGKYKNPKLVELYKYLFNETIQQEHRALSDALICHKCYYQISTVK